MKYPNTWVCDIGVSFVFSKTNNTLIDDTTAIENPETSGRQAGLQQGDSYPAIPMVQDKTAENDKVGGDNKQGTDKKEEIDRKRLCNGKIYFIEEVSLVQYLSQLCCIIWGLKFSNVTLMACQRH